MPHYRVLLVEDEAIVRELFIKTLDMAIGATFDVVTTDRLAGGLGILQNGEFDAIVLDLSLPDSIHDLDSIERYREAKNEAALIVVSGKILLQDVRKILARGADDVRSKPSQQPDWLIASNVERLRAKGQTKPPDITIPSPRRWYHRPSLWAKIGAAITAIGATLAAIIKALKGQG